MIIYYETIDLWSWIAPYPLTIFREFCSRYPEGVRVPFLLSLSVNIKSFVKQFMRFFILSVASFRNIRDRSQQFHGHAWCKLHWGITLFTITVFLSVLLSEVTILHNRRLNSITSGNVFYRIIGFTRVIYVVATSL